MTDCMLASLEVFWTRGARVAQWNTSCMPACMHHRILQRDWQVQRQGGHTTLRPEDLKLISLACYRETPQFVTLTCHNTSMGTFCRKMQQVVCSFIHQRHSFQLKPRIAQRGRASTWARPNSRQAVIHVRASHPRMLLQPGLLDECLLRRRTLWVRLDLSYPEWLQSTFPAQSVVPQGVAQETRRHPRRDTWAFAGARHPRYRPSGWIQP